MEEPRKITLKQLLWLNNHGGRTMFDVFIKDGKKFFYMDEKEHYIPNDDELEHVIRKIGYHQVHIVNKKLSTETN